MEIQFSAADLKPVVKAVVEETMARLEAGRETLGDRLAYSEPEAAALLGLTERQLADERRRGRITASSIVGRRIRYQRSDLLNYLQTRRVEITQSA